jgi:hypothetical protein
MESSEKEKKRKEKKQKQNMTINKPTLKYRVKMLENPFRRFKKI